MTNSDDDRAVVEGGRRLQQRPADSVRISGFKHSLVTVFAASIATHAEVLIDNCPDILETRILTRLVSSLGGHAAFASSRLTINSRNITNMPLDVGEAERIHGSLYLAPALISRFGATNVLSGRGGCQIGSHPSGTRPIEHYIDVLERFGAARRSENGALSLVAEAGFTPATIDLLDYCEDHATRTGPHYSGASKMAILTAAMTDGTSHLTNLYPKADVHDLIDFVALAGAKVIKTAPCSVTIGGPMVAHQRTIEFALTPDLIEIVTYAATAGLLLEGPLRMRMDNPTRALAGLSPEIAALSQLGVELTADGSNVTARRSSTGRPGTFVSESAGLYSDSMPFLLLLALSIAGKSHFKDTVWPDRFSYTAGLSSLNAPVRPGHGGWIIDGPWLPQPAESVIEADDLRGAAVLLLAALSTPATTYVRGLHHLARGYNGFIENLRALGARVTSGEPQ